MNRSILLVEGDGDWEFFSHLIKNTKGLAHIEIATPKALEADGDGFEGLLSILTKQVEQFRGGGTLAVVVDADYIISKKGLDDRRGKLLKEILAADAEYYPDDDSQSSVQPERGELVLHRDGLNPIGLWIMPDHQQPEGMLENLLIGTVSEGTRQELLKQISSKMQKALTTEEFAEILFKPIHKDKTLLNTWLNWQKKPNKCKNITKMQCALENDWFDSKNPNILALQNWLQRVFAQNDNN